MVAVQQQRSDSISVLPVSPQPATGEAAPATVPDLRSRAEVRGVAWDNHGDLIVTTATSILRMSPDGSRQTTLLSDPSQRLDFTSVCPAGGPILFSTYLREGKTSYNIWRIDADGSRPKQLSSGKADRFPLCSPDGASAYYIDAACRSMKMPIDGGPAELLKATAVPNGYMMGALNFSPDGRWMPVQVSISNAATQTSTHKIALVDVNADSEASTKYLEPRADMVAPIAFTPDGKAVAYNTFGTVLATCGRSRSMARRAIGSPASPRIELVPSNSPPTANRLPSPASTLPPT